MQATFTMRQECSELHEVEPPELEEADKIEIVSQLEALPEKITELMNIATTYIKENEETIGKMKKAGEDMVVGQLILTQLLELSRKDGTLSFDDQMEQNGKEIGRFIRHILGGFHKLDRMMRMK